MRYQVPFLKSLVRRDLELNLGLPDHWRTLCMRLVFANGPGDQCSIPG